MVEDDRNMQQAAPESIEVAVFDSSQCVTAAAQNELRHNVYSIYSCR